jgi:hypothetical protein
MIRSINALASLLLFGCLSIGLTQSVHAQMKCQAEWNDYQIALFTFNADPTLANANAVAATQAAYDACMNTLVPPHPAVVPLQQQ